MPDFPPFPTSSVRDALGVVRLLYAARKHAGKLPEPPEVDPLVPIGKDLRAALDLARGCEPGSLGYRSSVARAGAALERLASVVSLTDNLRDVVLVARERATGQPAPIRTKLAR